MLPSQDGLPRHELYYSARPSLSRQALSGPIHGLPQLPPLSHESADFFGGWQTISGQRGFRDERDYLDPSHNLASKKLRARKEDDVVIFNYSLNPPCLSSADGNTPAEEGGPSSGHFSATDDIFFRVPKNELIESKQFVQIINSPQEPRLSIMSAYLPRTCPLTTQSGYE